MDEIEVTEIALRLRNFEHLEKEYSNLKKQLAKVKDIDTEVHTWYQISPFTTISRIIDLFIVIVKLILIFIVLISILNVMIMSVYERIREIGTIAAPVRSARRASVGVVEAGLPKKGTKTPPSRAS